jgi:cell wall-associated NlpC family hydrolase
MFRPTLRKKLIAAGLGMVIMAGPVLSVSGAHGDPIADKQKQAADIAAKLSDLQHQNEDAANKYEAAMVKEQQLQGQIAGQQAQVDAAKAQQSQDQQALAQYAVNAYVTGGTSDNLTGLVNTSTDQLGEREGYAQAALGDRQQLIDNLAASQKESQDQIDRLNAAEKQVAAQKAAAAQQKQAAEQAQTQYAALNNQVQGELRQLVQAKQEADAKAAQEKAFAAAQAAAAANAARTASNGGGVISAALPSNKPSGRGGTYNGPPPPSNGGAGARAVAAAQTRLGDPYVWGASGPNTFDCSGLTMWSYAQAGVSIPRTTYDQINAGRQVPLSAIQPGDLVFYWDTGHVAMYVGGGTVIHAPHTGANVEYASLYMGTPEAVVRPY